MKQYTIGRLLNVTNMQKPRDLCNGAARGWRGSIPGGVFQHNRRVADIDVLSNIARMIPFRVAIRQCRYAALALFAALGACQPSEIVCRNTNWNWTHRPLKPEPVVDVILVTRGGSLLWNNTPVSWSELVTRLDLRAQSYVKPTTLLRHEDGVDCARLASVRGQVARSLDCSSGDCAEGHEWDVFPNNGFDGFGRGE